MVYHIRVMSDGHAQGRSDAVVLFSIALVVLPVALIVPVVLVLLAVV